MSPGSRRRTPATVAHAAVHPAGSNPLLDVLEFCGFVGFGGFFGNFEFFEISLWDH